MKVCIIGAGVSGIVSARHCLKNGIECEILESKSDIGGTWLYSELVGEDEYGFKLYSAMYKNLRTNLPKEVMSFPDFPHQPNRSFLTSNEIFQYLQNYVEEFKIKPLIKFNRLVQEVKLTGKDKWIVKSIDKPSKVQIIKTYDSVMICTGVYNYPVIPKIHGIEHFKGQQMHSNIYRTPEIFNNLNILIIGAGPSANDIVVHSLNKAKSIVLSHHNKYFTNFINTKNVTIKPDVLKILDNGLDVEFTDSSTYSPDIIVYCTGYYRKYEFLTEDCGLTLEGFHIRPLYKQVINIEHPTMSFIGVPNEVAAFRMIDLQCRFYVQYLVGNMKLPSKEDMLKDTENTLKKRIEVEEKPYPKFVHSFHKYQLDYYQELSSAANIENIPKVIFNMWVDVVGGIFGDVFNYKNYDYTVLDEEHFEKKFVKYDECY